MKIRTQFIVTMGLFGLLLTAIAISLVITSQRVDQLNRQEEIANNVEEITRELSYLSNDWLIHGEEPQRALWEAKFASFGEELKRLSPDTPEGQARLNEMEANRSRLGAVFNDIAIAMDTSARAWDAQAKMDFIGVSWNRLEVQDQLIVSDAILLARIMNDRVDQLNHANLILIMILVGIFGGYILINFSMIYWRTLRSLSILEAGTKVIGSGNLHFSLPEGRTDEIGELSRAFNRMTANLGELTASKADLEREMAERRKAEEATQEYARKLEQSNKELENFAQVASHDLQEPLRKIEMFGSIVKEKAGPSLSENDLDYLRRMQDATGRMRGMIEGLLSLSRVTTRGRPFVAVDLKQAARTALDDLEMRLRQTGGKVEIGELPVVQADPLQIQQVFQNLIGNALKFHRPDIPPLVKVYQEQECTGAGMDGSEAAGELLTGAPYAPLPPELCSSAPRPSSLVAIVVEDNGIGFEQQQAAYIFQPFHRLHGRSEYEGGGIGLSICRKIVERHGGSITARSAPGVGSAFIFTLPR